MDENVREIPLSRGMVALVDECDYERVSQFKWYAMKHPKRKIWYAARNIFSQNTGRKRTQHLHRFIMNDCDSPNIDHKDGDGLNCRRSNLRPATVSQNMMNVGPMKNNKSGFRGVCWHKVANKWMAQIKFNGKLIYLGCFVSAEDAARAYDAKAKALFGEFAKPNIIDQDSGHESSSFVD